ncbi:DNA mismatch repair protein Mlh1 [Lecanora helva]
MPILCERFTTSKLQTFEDLTSIGTYGFRGEALASISHIAHLTITTKTADSSCAWRASYADGRLAPPKPGQSAEPKACAGRGGTQIKVEDLFFNVPSRQKAFRSPSEEYAKILDVVGRYAVHCLGVAFSCKKLGESANSISTPSNAGTIDVIRQIHGAAVANELISFEISDLKWGFKASGWTSNANYSVKKTTILLFINHRSVESSAIKKAVEQTYSAFLPKGGHPFIYLSLDIDPQRVDVNVHPTKREVNFLNEDEIIESICGEITSKLSQVDTSRTFTTQSLLPNAKVPVSTTSKSPNDRSESTRKPPPSTPAKPYENNLVRTDPQLRKITSMLPPSTSNPTTPAPPSITYQSSPRTPTTCCLTTVKRLRASVRDSMHQGLTEVFASHTYVGIVDLSRRLVAIQGGVKLFLVDYGMVCNEYFYQLGLTDFGNFGAIKFEPPLDANSLIEIGANHEKKLGRAEDKDVPWGDVPELVTNQLIDRRAMLVEYFNLDIDEEGKLISIPLLLKGYCPSLAKLPRFLMRLGPCVDWVNEEGCFHSFLRELASFYTPEQLPQSPGSQPGAESPDESHADIETRRDELSRLLEHVLFPAFKARLVATKGLLKGVTETHHNPALAKIETAAEAQRFPVSLTQHISIVSCLRRGLHPMGPTPSPSKRARAPSPASDHVLHKVNGAKIGKDDNKQRRSSFWGFPLISKFFGKNEIPGGDEFEGDTIVNDDSTAQDTEQDEYSTFITDADGHGEERKAEEDKQTLREYRSDSYLGYDDPRLAEWTDEETWFFTRLRNRGREPLLDRTWFKDFMFLPDRLFTTDPARVLITSNHCTSYRGIRAFSRLCFAGPGVRCQLTSGAAPEKPLFQEITSFYKWTIADAKLQNKKFIPITAIACAKPKETTESVVSRVTDQLHDLGRQWRNKWRHPDSNEGDSKQNFTHPMPTLFGFVIKYTVTAIVTYDSRVPRKPIRTLHTADWKVIGQDAWHAMAVGTALVRQRDYLMKLDAEGELGPDIPDTYDPDA